MYTLKDVAKKAGVSPTIASYVLNNSNYVSAEKRAAVLQAAKELNYHVNSNARGLRKKERQNKALVDKISATIILQSYMESCNSK